MKLLINKLLIAIVTGKVRIWFVMLCALGQGNRWIRPTSLCVSSSTGLAHREGTH